MCSNFTRLFFFKFLRLIPVLRRWVVCCGHRVVGGWCRGWLGHPCCVLRRIADYRLTATAVWLGYFVWNGTWGTSDEQWKAMNIVLCVDRLAQLVQVVGLWPSLPTKNLLDTYFPFGMSQTVSDWVPPCAARMGARTRTFRGVCSSGEWEFKVWSSLCTIVLGLIRWHWLKPSHRSRLQKLPYTSWLFHISVYFVFSGTWPTGERETTTATRKREAGIRPSFARRIFIAKQNLPIVQKSSARPLAVVVWRSPVCSTCLTELFRWVYI